MGKAMNNLEEGMKSRLMTGKKNFKKFGFVHGHKDPFITDW